MKKRISIDLNGPDGNIFALIGIVSEATGIPTSKLFTEVKLCETYQQALSVLNQYIEIVPV